MRLHPRPAPLAAALRRCAPSARRHRRTTILETASATATQAPGPSVSRFEPAGRPAHTTRVARSGPGRRVHRYAEVEPAVLKAWLAAADKAERRFRSVDTGSGHRVGDRPGDPCGGEARTTPICPALEVQLGRLGALGAGGAPSTCPLWTRKVLLTSTPGAHASTQAPWLLNDAFGSSALGPRAVTAITPLSAPG